jgi:hypothetical protein
MKKNEKDNRNVSKTNENDYVRLLLTKTFQKTFIKKNRKEILMDIVSKTVNDVVYLSTFASYFDVNKHGVCQHPEGWHKAPMSSHTLGSLAI